MWMPGNIVDVVNMVDAGNMVAVASIVDAGNMVDVANMMVLETWSML